MLEKLRNKRVCILGFGLEGKATFEYLKSHGIDASVCDLQTEEGLLAENYSIDSKRLHLGPNYLASVKEYEIIVKTPGISPLTPELQQVVANGALVTSLTEMFFDICPCPIIGVTGTKGKGTTSTMIHDILAASGSDVYLGGNIGNPALSFVDSLTEDSIVVLELSSFQLQVLKRSPHIAVLLNVTSEHLDYHKDTEEYREAKANIARYQNNDDILIVNADYPVPQAMVETTKSRKLYFSKSKVVDGCYVDKNDDIVLSLDGKVSVLANASEMKLRGRHNLENITAASLAASVAGVPDEIISTVIKGFVGLEHRLELVREVSGVSYYNDSFSTVPETAIAAIDSFSEPIVLIAGGSSKKSDYTELGRKIKAANIRALILIGQTAPEIQQAVGAIDSFEIITGLTKMDEIVAKARELALEGDVVLLSPACASKGLFENYKDRGNQFKKTVASL